MKKIISCDVVSMLIRYEDETQSRKLILGLISSQDLYTSLFRNSEVYRVETNMRNKGSFIALPTLSPRWRNTKSLLLVDHYLLVL